MKRSALKKNGPMDIFCIVTSWFWIIICLLPLLNVIAISLSENRQIVAGNVYLWPKGLDLTAYRSVLGDATMIWSFGFTVLLTVTYVFLCMTMTILCAYPLSRKNLMGRKYISAIILFTMYFSGGLIPTYLLLKDLHLINTFWVLVLPGLINTYNMIIMRSFFSNSIPESLIEYAQVEGCGEWRILLQIVLPLSKPVLATLSLFYAVSRWNGFMDALYYISDQKLYPLQYKLYQIVNANMAMSNDVSLMENLNMTAINPEAIKSACIICTITPIILVYPFLQKYFVKGVMVGSVKG